MNTELTIERRVSTLRVFPYFIVNDGEHPVEDGFGRILCFDSKLEAMNFILDARSAS
jgi:hypothetical protein